MTELKLVNSAAFVEAQQALVDELDDEMRSWNLAKMCEELRAAARSLKVKGGKNIRTFSAKYLGLPNQGYKKVVLWLAHPSLMTTADIVLILATLKKFRDEHLDEIIANEKALAEAAKKRAADLAEVGRRNAGKYRGTAQQQHSPPLRPPKVLPPMQSVKATTEIGLSPTSVRKQLVSHTLTILSSLSVTLSLAQVTPADAYDSERMLIREKLQKICNHLGIKASFTDVKKVRTEPVTYGELSKLVSSQKGEK